MIQIYLVIKCFFLFKIREVLKKMKLAIKQMCSLKTNQRQNKTGEQPFIWDWLVVTDFFVSSFWLSVVCPLESCNARAIKGK